MTSGASKIDATNPMGTDGFEFVEYAAPDPSNWPSFSAAWASPPWPGTNRRM